MYKPGDRKYKNEWVPITEQKPPCDDHYLVTTLHYNIYRVYEAVFIKSSGIFVDPVEEWEEVKNVIAWSYIPHPYIPQLQIPIQIK